MKLCKTCGCEIEVQDGLDFCPTCLLTDALEQGAPSATETSANPESSNSGVATSLKLRLDFFEKYQVLRQVGSGGQGEVWEVWDFQFRRTLAMKRLSNEMTQSPAASHRFIAEAQLTSQLRHPGILPIYDLALDPDGKAFYTTDLLTGSTFAEVWQGVKTSDPGWPLYKALEMLIRVAEVMAHAHSRGVIHRDLKPSNIMVGQFGDVRVIDWGSARVLAGSQHNLEKPLNHVGTDQVRTDRDDSLQPDLMTGTAGQPLTISFVPPEILCERADLLGPKTDIYSMGVMLYELLTHRLPFADEKGKLPQRDSLVELIKTTSPTPVRHLNRKASLDLAAICAKAMARSFEDRYRSMTELMEDLRAALAIRPVQARRPGPWLALQKWALRNISFVLIGSLSLVFISIMLSLAHSFKAERDSARQIQALRSAELAARSGHWREAIKDWDEAEADGYGDSIDLNLQRAEAWTVLSEPDRAGALLTHLAARSDLGDRRGVVLLRLGEHDLFDRTKSAHGIQLVREAMTVGLTNADLYFAKGLLAESTPEALELFHQALQFDPYHHGAHRQSLSLEFLLGRHQDLANHLAIFRILYPDDPSPGFIAAAESAMRGDLAGAQKELATLHNQVNSNTWEQLSLACQAYAAAAKFYSVDSFLNHQANGLPELDKLRTNLFSTGFLLLPSDIPGATNLPGNLRISRLPCLQNGLLEESDGLRELLLPYLANPVLALKQIKSGWQHHPEALVPVLAGLLLENQQSETGFKSVTILQMQAQLFQMGSDSPSMMPQIERLARYLAASTEFAVVAERQTNSPHARADCLANIRRAIASPETSVAECHAYFQFALGLGDDDLALRLVSLLEKQQSNDPATRRSRIQVELAIGAFGPALEQINQLLADNPNDTWALTQRQIALSGIKKSFDSIEISRKSTH
jgi:serine/threonine protein kinase